MSDETGSLVTFPRARPPKKRPPDNLPLELTSFIGREREVAEVERLLASRRLVTLCGPGGCGKTRLALAVARDLVEGFEEDGVWWVELASLSDPKLVPRAVASALGVREAPDRSPTEVLAEHLKPKRRFWFWTTASTWWRDAPYSPILCSGPARTSRSWRPAGSLCA